jgi:23S rRNA-/tRNA-specific pseudouridylate synthase
MDTARTERIERAFSSTYHRWLFYSSRETEGSLFETLRVKLSHIPSTEIPERVAWGGVFVNGIEANQDCVLPIPCKLEYYEPRFDISNAADYFPQWQDNFVLYEDEFLIVVYKPARLPTNPGKEQKYFNLKSYVQQYTGCVLHLPSRLDMSTCGVCLMSKHPSTHKPLQRLYEHGLVMKFYCFASAETPEWRYLDVNTLIGKDREHPVLRRVVDQGGKASRTEIWNVASRAHSLFLARPHTGRTHQIRVHARHIGVPICGDNFYHGAVNAQGLQLMAYCLRFRHPRGGAWHEITMPDRLYPHWFGVFEAEDKIRQLIARSGSAG